MVQRLSYRKHFTSPLKRESQKLRSSSRHRQRCLQFRHCGNLHGDFHCSPLSSCHSEEALQKSRRKKLICLQPAWHTVILPPLARQKGRGHGAGFIVAAQFLWHCSVEDLEGRWGKVISGLHYKETSYWKPFVISCKATFYIAIKSNFFHWYNAPHFSKIYFYLQSTVRWGELHIKD